MSEKRWIVIGVGALLSSGSCELQEGHNESYCRDTRRECHLSYSALSGYQRYCSSVASPCEPELSTEPNRPAKPTRDAGSGAAPAPTPRAAERGAAPLPEGQRYSAFDLPCERDSQCGPGRCSEGQCFYGCQSDSQCGTGDRCATEQGTRICLPDPNPPVRCTRSAQCDGERVCLNGTCMQSCTSTDQCENLVDRCASGICQPDRRPLGECVLTSECATGFVCLDGACVAACAQAGDAGVCLPGGPLSIPPAARPEQPPTDIPLAPVDAGNSGVPPASTGSEPAETPATPGAAPVEPIPTEVLDAGPEELPPLE